jgi:UDP-N-acetylglucosamine--N-acetylmuramyl-(pentapeptide) pyrophosphoryl-undecaprenol N-acetylglucosamine transferase
MLRAAAERLPAERQERYHVHAYLHSERGAPAGGPSMTAALGAADLAICRSGASTLGELTAAGLPAILVPYPYVHQDENADYLARRGAAVKVGDGEMLGNGRPEDGPLLREVRRLTAEPDERASMARRSRSLARPDAARQLADLLLALAARRRAA